MSNIAINGNNELTMTSREIAVLVESRHTDVCRSIERLMDAKAISGYAPSAYTHEQNGQQYQEYRINKRDSYVVVAQLSPLFTARLVDRWQELESRNLISVPKTLSEALRLAADQAEVIERQQLELSHARPAVQFLEQYVETRSTKSLREVAKVLGQREREFISKLHADGIIFKQAGSWYPHADYHHRGYFEVKTGEANGHAFNQTRFTPSGIALIAKRFGLMGAA